MLIEEIDSSGSIVAINGALSVQLNDSMSNTFVTATNGDDYAEITDSVLESRVNQSSISYSVSSGDGASSYCVQTENNMQSVGVEHRGRVSSIVYHTPNGTTYWKPNVPDEFVPVKYMEFETWNDAVNMYNTYADKSGFSIRLSTIKRVKGSGGSHNVNGTKTYFQNATKDVRLFISDRDVQMIVDTMTSRSVNLPNFSFEYKVVGSELRYIFWADDVSKCNYDAFGEVLGFDATYSTNKYGMIFIPFTGVDHHKKCVTFGAGLIYDETIESYKWLLDKFLKTHKKQPKLVLTDQDAAVKQAVRAVFDQSIHRLCMWHIIMKIPLKILGDLLANMDLRVSIHKLVWNLFITPSTYQEQWKLLIDDLNLSDHHWLTEIYAIKEQWVPCYFREIQWCCLMKSTSRCESSNSLFKVNTSHANTLVQFLLCFGTALDRQRKTQLELDIETSTTTPKMLEKLSLEIHASNIYTRKIFLEVQKEIYRGMRQCYITSSLELDGIKKFNIAHTNKRFKVVNNYVVDFNAHDQLFLSRVCGSHVLDICADMLFACSGTTRSN
ncbi:protein FAR1-RELATED SEQUENCE 5-like [Bidens hawaiensis]|uniref:protein FAR1-RELATED SEQUENCE 5-like n=1 Tax=Bidens hawaiensis TaxID=980011 RepID=UPI004049008D